MVFSFTHRLNCKPNFPLKDEIFSMFQKMKFHF